MVRELSVESFYARLRKTVLASPTSTLMVFPSTSDVDSLCTLKIVSHIIQSDSIRYGSYPVSSFREIQKYVGETFESSDQYVTVLLINWGCQRDLRKILNLGPKARVFIVDSHRPIHLHNLNDQNERVVVLYTREDEQQADLSYDFDVSALANAADLDSDDEIDEKSDDSESESESEDDEEDGRDGGSSKRRKVADESDENPIKLFRKLKREYYHLGSFHGKPSGSLMFDLSHSLRRNTNELLWLACVSLTDQFVHERLTNERYQDGVMELEQRINDGGNLAEITSVTLKDGTKIRAPETSRIAYEDEPRLMLLREWNLFDSMQCSSYIATKLKTWSDNGLKNLKLLLAQMGFALIDCQQKFQYMNHEVKKKMKDEFDHYLPKYGLSEFYYRSFLRLHGYSSKVSAADVVYGVTALLEVQTDGSCASEQFNVAYDALSLNNIDILRKGMQSAIKVQRAILRQGSAAITRRSSIINMVKFKWMTLEDAADTKLLAYPQALTKFCYFVMDALRERGERLKPLVCACSTQEPKKFLIVGVCGKPRLGAVQGNAFGAAFRAVAEEVGGESSHEMFESSWIVLDTDVVKLSTFRIRITEKL
ncbi:hypothetical protein GIB67_006696 [Kingdonia uniflora]|uniref:Uncharacterized protein n=1 Tax=Kingdonia uniflora TaxID=39325 RepID=A0A7J7LYN0_9MAGN|nr:hypothetical protein GIB67_006696 [Kingdonia uniflora]